MKLVRNTGTDRVIDVIRPGLARGHHLHALTPALSLFAFGEVMREAGELARCRLVLPPAPADLGLLGSAGDRAARNRLRSRWLAQRLARWIQEKAEIRRAVGSVPQGAFVLRDSNGQPTQALLGSLAFSTDGLGLTPGNPMSLIQASETPEEAALLSQWFDAQWSSLVADPAAKTSLIEAVQAIAVHHEPSLIYAVILQYLF